MQDEIQTRVEDKPINRRRRNRECIVFVTSTAIGSIREEPKSEKSEAACGGFFWVVRPTLRRRTDEAAN
jgi:hypothetical protein